MSRDVRAYIYCNIGRVISGTISDSSVVDSGLVRVSGEILLDGIYTPARGSTVQLAYHKQGTIGAIGRSLRVLGYYSNPITRQTQVKVGCTLTYHSETVSTEAVLSTEDTDDDLNLSELERLATISPTNAATVFNRCCTIMGINRATCPLTNQFYTEEFSLEGSLINLMSDLLKSENYVGYMDSNNVLQYINLASPVNNGAVLNGDNLIEIAPIESDAVNADVVFSNVAYRSIRLDSAISGTTTNAIITASELSNAVRDRSYPYTLSGYSQDYIASRRDYRWKNPTTGQTIEASIYWYPSTEWTADYDSQGRMVSRNETKNGPWGDTRISSTISYDSSNGSETQTEVIYEYGPLETVIEAIGYPEEMLPPLPGNISAAASTNLIGGWTRKTVRNTYDQRTSASNSLKEYTLNCFTSDGSASLAKIFESYESSNYSGLSVNSMALLGVKVVLDKSNFTSETKSPDFNMNEGSTLRPGWPASTPTTAASVGNAPDNNSTAVTEVTTRPEILFRNNVTGGIVLELTPPYVSDDRVVRSGSTFSVVRSNAAAKARAYATIQNKLRLGQINGQAVVLPVEYRPAAPFSAVYLNFGGVTGQFRYDQTSIAFDNTGILFSADCLFWGGVGA